MKLWLLLLFAHRYRVEGIVIQTKPAPPQIVVAHRPIDNYMPAMTMPFRVGRSVDLTKLTPGTRVAFELKVSKNASLARDIRVEGQNVADVPPKPVNTVAIGLKIPDFLLIDQTGKPFRLSEHLGKIVVVDFIYTRCPLPDVCPRLSANFSSVSKKLRGQGVEFLSITIDPQYDTPEVLAQYARRYQAGESWKFLTGAPTQVQEVAGLFGLVYWPEEGSITHAVATAVIGRDGTLVARIDGAAYRPDQLLALIQQALQ